MDLPFNLLSLFLVITLFFFLGHGQEIAIPGAKVHELTFERSLEQKVFKEFSISGQSLLNAANKNTALPIDLVITSQTLEVKLSTHAKTQVAQTCHAILIPRQTEEEEAKQKYSNSQIPFEIFLKSCNALNCGKRGFIHFQKDKLGGVEDLSAFHNTLMTLYITCNQTDSKTGAKVHEQVSLPLNIKVPKPLPLLETKDADINQYWRSVHEEDIRELFLPFKIDKQTTIDNNPISLEVCTSNSDQTFDICPQPITKRGPHLVGEDVKRAEEMRKAKSIVSEPPIFKSFNLWNILFTPSTQGEVIEAIVEKNLEKGKLELQKDINGIPHCEVTLTYDLNVDSKTKISKALNLFRCTGVNCGMEVNFHFFEAYVSSLNNLVSAKPTRSLLNVSCYIKKDRKYINTDTFSYKLDLKIVKPIALKESAQLSILKNDVGPVELDKAVLDYIPFGIPELAFRDPCFFYSRQISFVDNVKCAKTAILSGRCLHQDAYAESLQIGAEFILRNEKQEVLNVEELEKKLKLDGEECRKKNDEPVKGENVDDDEKDKINVEDGNGGKDENGANDRKGGKNSNGITEESDGKGGKHSNKITEESDGKGGKHSNRITEENDVKESSDSVPESQSTNFINSSDSSDSPCIRKNDIKICCEQGTSEILSTGETTESEVSSATSITLLASFCSLMIIVVYML